MHWALAWMTWKTSACAEGAEDLVERSYSKTTSTFYLSPPSEHSLFPVSQKSLNAGPWSLSFVKRVFGSWYWYSFVMLRIIAGKFESFSSSSLLAMYMKPTKGYSVAHLNNHLTTG
jgi:MFS transporter, ACS family, pantothenate transporter